jgi:hypothetical protein
MTVEQAQREVRTVFLASFPGALAASFIWFVSTALSTWSSPHHGILALSVGGAFIFPIAQLILKAMGRRATLSPENPLGALAMQVAFTIPLSLPLIAAASYTKVNWFYPAFTLVVGAHYLPFVFLYGMKQFGILAGVMVAGAVFIGVYAPGSFTLAGWFTTAVLLGWSFVALSVARQEGSLQMAGSRA